jgi:hypothetical protein
MVALLDRLLQLTPFFLQINLHYPMIIYHLILLLLMNFIINLTKSLILKFHNLLLKLHCELPQNHTNRKITLFISNFRKDQKIKYKFMSHPRMVLRDMIFYHFFNPFY